MNMEPLRELILRHEQGDRDPELIAALSRAAWEHFHDPWEEDDAFEVPDDDWVQEASPLPWDPQERREVTPTTLDLYLMRRYPKELKREERPFLLEYRMLEFSQQGREASLHIEGGEGSNLLFRIVFRLRQPKTDLPKALVLVKEWNEKNHASQARLVKPKECPYTHDGGPPKAVLLALEAPMALDPSEPGLSQEWFHEQLDGFMESAGAFLELAFETHGL